MKKYVFAIFWLFSITAYGKVWTVDNQNPSVADTNSLAAAINVAKSGDTIMVMGSLNSYGAISLAKRLVIYGSSHQPMQKDLDLNTSITSITIYTGGNGSKLVGFRITQYLELLASNCVIECNEFQAGIMVKGSNNLIQGNLITGYYSSSSSKPYIAFDKVTGNQIRNNYMLLKAGSTNYTNSFSFFSGGDTSNLIKNNLMVELVDGSGTISNGGIVFFRGSQAKVYDNIFWSNVPSRTDFDTLNSGSDFKNNITYSVRRSVDKLPGSNFNNMQPQFKGGYDDIILPIYRPENKMQLDSLSVGQGAGTDGYDVGLFGANYQFRMRGGNPYLSYYEEVTVRNSSVRIGEKLKVHLQISPSQ